MYGAFTYIGCQISNGLIVYVIMWAIGVLISIIFLWKASHVPPPY